VSHNCSYSFWIRIEVIRQIETGHALLCINHKDRESNGKPAKVSGDKIVKFVKLFNDIFSQLLPWQRRQKYLLAFFMPNRIDIPQAYRITIVALHLGVF